MWADSLSEKEVDYTTRILAELRAAPWAAPLRQRIEERGGVTSDNMPLLFEARFAYELFRRGLRVQYEYAAGVGSSTVEFRISDLKEWLIELVSIRESDGLRMATRQDGDFFHRNLSSHHLRKPARDEQKQSEEAEMITAQHKIGEKVLTGAQPTKFPFPGGAVHAILVDMRGYIGSGGDWIDYRQIAYGPGGVPADAKSLFTVGKASLLGVSSRSSITIPRRQQAFYKNASICWVLCQKETTPKKEIADRAYWLPNPNLVTTVMEAEIKKTFPLCVRCA